MNNIAAEPPDWGPDSLSAKYFKNAEYNDRAIAANYPDVFDLLKQIHECFERIEDVIGNDKGALRLVPRFLLVRTHSTFLAACRLAMSGQISEAQALNRAAIEQAWYALHIAKDPGGWPRAETWLRRNESDAAEKACKNEFTVANVRQTHAALDADTAKHLAYLYDQTINFGAHPNQMGVMSAIRHVEDAEKIVFNVGILAPDPHGVMATVRVAAAVAIGTFKVFQLIYPERFAIAGLEDEVGNLVALLNTVFKRFVVKTA